MGGSFVVARAWGVSTAVIDRPEDGSNQSNISVSFVLELAAILGVDVAELLANRPDRRPTGEPDLIEADDPETVGAVVAGNGRTVAVVAVAAGLGWSLQRTLLALDELTVRLPSVG